MRHLRRNASRPWGACTSLEWHAIRKERFSITPEGLYNELVRTAEMHLRRSVSERQRRCEWLNADLEPEATDDEEPAVAPEAMQAGTPDIYGVDLEVFKMKTGRRVRGWKRCVQIAGWVAIDEMRSLLEMHYDDVHLQRYREKEVQTRRRKGSHSVFQAAEVVHRQKLCQRIDLPLPIKELLRRPEDENDWEKVEQVRVEVIAIVQSREASPMDDFCWKLASDRRVVQAIARSWRPKALTIEEMLDRLLLALWDALFLAQCIRWSTQNVANLYVDETPELARWFMLGQSVGSGAIFDGICAMCGTLLHGPLDAGSSQSNKSAGPPLNRDEDAVWADDGRADTGAQPPFLLRWSPSKLAQEAPSVFQHDPATNSLSLKPGVPEPWIRPATRRANAANTWLYCCDCKSRYFHGGPRQSHIPYRDRASQHLMRAVSVPRAAGQTSNEPRGAEPSSGEPEHEPAIGSASVGHREAAPEHAADLMETDGEGEAAEQLELDVGADAMDTDDESEETAPDLPADKKFPTLPEYQEKWGRLLALHSRGNAGEFSRENLVPEPISQLWQDCPYVPFDQLKSKEAKARLSRCRLVSGFEDHYTADGVPTYAHCTGELNFRRRQPLQIAATLGLILTPKNSKFKGLKPEEMDALHECLTWGRVRGNNKFQEFFGGEDLTRFASSCKKLMSKVKSLLPEGSHRARIRAYKRETRHPKEGVLGDTLGDEPDGMVVVDMEGTPMKYDQVGVYEDVIAKQTSRIEIDVPRENGKGWRRAGATLSIQDEPELDESWRHDLSNGARYLLEETWVKANEPHYDAKCWPCKHPYGTGSLLSEQGSGGPQHYARNRLCSIDSCFRRDPEYVFWKNDYQTKSALFWGNTRKQARAPGPAAETGDQAARLFGTVLPSSIRDSTAWWQKQQHNLFALTDEAELGLMQEMITLSHNDYCPEMLAAIRRGPLAPPTEDEKVEYLMNRARRDRERPSFGTYGLEHTLSFQRRVHAMKKHFSRVIREPHWGK